MIKENIYVAINHNDEIQWVTGSSSRTRYFRTDKYLKRAVKFHNIAHPEDKWKIRKCIILEDSDNFLYEVDPKNLRKAINCEYDDGK